jgi:hypothetical protein
MDSYIAHTLWAGKLIVSIRYQKDEQDATPKDAKLNNVLLVLIIRNTQYIYEKETLKRAIAVAVPMYVLHFCNVTDSISLPD